MTTISEAPLATLFELMTVVADCYPPEVRQIVEDELPPLKMRALRLALEIATAESESLAFVDAVKQPLNFPLMTRLNHGAIAMLHYEVPEEALSYIRYLFSQLATRDWGGLRDTVVTATQAQTPEGALLRFLLYQAARVERWIRTWDIPALEATGALAQIDREAQEKLEYWLMLSPTLPSSVSPVRLADAEIMLGLNGLARLKSDELRTLQVDAMDRFRAILTAATTARELGFEDSIALRNDYQDDIGERRLASAELAEMYPQAFPSANAVDQRAHRIRTALADDSIPVRSGGVRLLDVFRTIIADEIDKESA